MIYIILLTILYIVPMIISYFGIRYQFNNEWRGLKVDGGAYTMVFVPLINIGYAMFTFMILLFEEVIGEPLYSKSEFTNDKSNFGSKFFMLK